MATSAHSDMSHDPKLIGAYPSGWIWPEQEFDLMKNLIPFFDGLAIFMPEHLVERVVDSDPFLVRPLFEAGDLWNINPDTALSDAMSAEISQNVNTFVEQNGEAIKRKIRNEARMQMETRTSSHLGSSPEAEALINRLIGDGLAEPVAYDGTFKVEGGVKRFIMQSLFGVMSAKLAPSETQLVPVTNEFSEMYPYQGAGKTNFYQFGPRSVSWDISRIITQDIREVGVDLRAVPLDEVLDFSTRYRAEYRTYLRSLHETVRAILTLSNDGKYVDDIRGVLRDRLDALHEQSDFLRRSSRSEFRRKSLSLLVSITGSAWTIRTGDYVGATLAAVSAAVGLVSPPDNISEYCYLFKLAQAR